MRRLLLCVFLAAGCRDAVQPFSADHYGPRSDSVVVRLTYHRGFDEAPTWSLDGDTVYYSAAAFSGLLTSAQGALVGVPREGGSARLMLPALQAGFTGTQVLTAPVLSRDGKRVAFFDVREPIGTARVQCDRTVCTNNIVGFQFPLLGEGQLRVRAPDGSVDQAVLAVSFIGARVDPTRPPPAGPITFEDLPFQHRYTQFRQPTFRASWAPDNTRLVVSDGQRLLIWQPGSAPTPIPGTDDGVWAAWSPNGEWIAYTHLPRGNRITASCECQRLANDGTVVVVQLWDLVGYTGNSARGILTLIRPDGTGKRQLGEGEAPAWLPDNSALIVSRGTSLSRISADGTAAVELPHTSGGGSPSVSSDGKYLAYSRLLQGELDIWVLRLDGAGN
jgi:hypothetical protein